MHLKEGMRGYLVDLSICIPLKGEMDAGLAALKDTTDPVLLSNFFSLRLHFLSQIVLSMSKLVFFQAPNLLIKIVKQIINQFQSCGVKLIWPILFDPKCSLREAIHNKKSLVHFDWTSSLS